MLHRIEAKNRHGLHSPFVYRLADIVFYDYHTKKVYPEIEKINKDLPATQKAVAHGLNRLKVNQLLYRLAVDLKPGNLILLGIIPAITRLYLQKAVPDAEVYTSTSDIPQKLDFVLINGGGQTLKYFKDCLPKVHEDTVFVFAGIYDNERTEKAWHEIKVKPQVTVTIYLFWIGLVFFRKGQAKEDFLIKI